MGRGRPTTNDHDLIKRVLVNNKNLIISEDNIIAVPSDEIWERLGPDCKKEADVLYSYVVCNRNNIKTILLGNNEVIKLIKNK